MSEYIIDWNDNLVIDTFSKNSLREEIVRCGDCKHCMAYMMGAYCDYMAHAVDPDGFCAWASKRKEDGDGR